MNEPVMDDITAKRIESKLDEVLKYQVRSRETMSEIASIVDGRLRHSKDRVEALDNEVFRLRAALNNLIGAIVNKQIIEFDESIPSTHGSLREDVEEARAALEVKDE